MDIIETSGLVIKENNVLDSDKIITVFSLEYGKIRIYIKGARKPKSNFLGGTQLFTYSRFYIYNNGDLKNINKVDIIKTYNGFSEDLVKLAYASYILELVNEVLLEEENRELLKLTLLTLSQIEKNIIPIKLITDIFIFKMLCIIGYTPYLLSCIQCNLHSDIYYYSYKNGGVLCDKCRYLDRESSIISSKVLYTMNYIINSSIKSIYRFKLSEDIYKEFHHIVNTYLKYYINKKFKSLEFLKTIEKL